MFRFRAVTMILVSMNELSFACCYQALLSAAVRLPFLLAWLLSFRMFSTSWSVFSGLLKSGMSSWHIFWSCSLICFNVLLASSKSVGACCWQKEGSNLVMAPLKTLAPSLLECHRLLAKAVSYMQMAWHASFFLFFFLVCVRSDVDYWPLE